MGMVRIEDKRLILNQTTGEFEVLAVGIEVGDDLRPGLAPHKVPRLRKQLLDFYLVLTGP